MEGKLKARSGTEKRLKQHRITFRLADSEHAQLVAAAEREGQTLGTYIRSRVLVAPTTRARRRPVVEVQAITRLQGEMNKVGSNIYQLTRRINFGETPESNDIRAAFAGYKEVIAAIMAALGRGQR
jgi:uncharacterized protein (DUF1778 family)